MMISMKHIIIWLSMIFAVSTAKPAFAKIIPFTVDAAQFRYDSSHTLWEMYYSFPDSSLRYVGAANQLVGELYVKTVIYSPHDTAAVQEWVVSNKRDTHNFAVVKNLIGQKLFVLKPGISFINCKTKMFLFFNLFFFLW